MSDECHVESSKGIEDEVASGKMEKKSALQISEVSTSNQETTILHKILDKLTASEQHNRLLEQRIQNLEKKASESDEMLKTAEETIRATCHYLRESSVIIESQAAKLKESEQSQKAVEENLTEILGKIASREFKELRNQLYDMQEKHVETIENYADNHDYEIRKVQRQLRFMEDVQRDNRKLLKKIKEEKRALKDEDIAVGSDQPKCLFCNVLSHVSDDCPTFRTQYEREKRLNELNLCDRCLKRKDTDDHFFCTNSDVVCPNCAESFENPSFNHHPTLCSFKEEKRNEEKKTNRYSPY